jgi:hypothetical protein
MDSTEVSGVADEKYIYLTTIGRKTGNPHTVELWFAVAMGNIYLSHEGAYTDWMKNILKDDTVEFRIGGRRFKGKAHIYRDGAAFEIGKHALYLKYYGEASKDVVDDWFSESTVIEMTLE